ncbi:GNAT family N-acetyltransferase [uncultured Phascolarctobacterium sp.]|uniref:GNAT family N-acetyltransferase n=1 Tax=uncultured Phascolarctobacterium sp. TaxID=512296 RepID=UPI0027D9CD97|nr:GNAT family N-acetyltransferase [uncultured Phascolarctobacterium sp.]
MSMKYMLRLAEPADAEKLLEIYAPFVISSDRKLSDVSFEYEVPSAEEFTERIKNISAAYPYIVCEHDGRLLGYVYAHPYIPRAAYQWGAEVTIYLAPEGQGRG